MAVYKVKVILMLIIIKVWPELLLCWPDSWQLCFFKNNRKFEELPKRHRIVRMTCCQKGYDSGICIFIKLTLYFLTGSVEERIAVETACRHGSKSEAFSSPTAEDTFVEVTMDGAGPRMGEDAKLNIVMRNSSSEHRKVLLHGRVTVMYYTGVHKATVKRDRTEVDLLPFKGEWNSGWVSKRRPMIIPVKCQEMFISCCTANMLFSLCPQ